MISIINSTNFAITSCALIVAFIGLIGAISQREKNALKKFFTVFFSLLLTCTVLALFSQISLVFFDSRAMEFSSETRFFSLLLSSIFMPLLTLFFLQCSGVERKYDGYFYAILIGWIAHIILLITAQHTKHFYYFTKDNILHPGKYYFVLVLPPFMLMVINLITMLFRKNYLSPRQKKAFLCYVIIPPICMVALIWLHSLFVIVFGIALSALFLMLFILLDETDKRYQQEKENAQLRASTMVLQMRPHFIYNTMMSIYYLCEQDTKKAQQMILDFSSYLRKNFTALVKEDTIPFTEELEHTRAYLAVEQVRFADKLFITFDTPVTQFRLPPLTLQPIVENAVKHGIDAEADAMSITIRTERRGNAVLLTVEDTGAGVYADETDSPHIALNNIRERLALMCGGTLRIDSDADGTAVTVSIPQ